MQEHYLSSSVTHHQIPQSLLLTVKMISSVSDISIFNIVLYSIVSSAMKMITILLKNKHIVLKN